MAHVEWFWDDREQKLVDHRPAWWAERRAALGRGARDVTKPVVTYELKGGSVVKGFQPESNALKEAVTGKIEEIRGAKADPPCDAVVDVGDCYIAPTPRVEKTYGSTYDNEPWKKINKAMFPNTWRWYVLFYYSGSYYTDTRSSDYKPTSYNAGYNGNYHGPHSYKPYVGASYKSPGSGSGTSVHGSGDKKTEDAEVKKFTDEAVESWRKTHGGGYNEDV